MDVLYFLVPLAVLFSSLAVVFFVGAIRRGQFEDLQTPAVRILMDEEESDV